MNIKNPKNIKGTTKFEVCFFRGTPKKATTPQRKLHHFVYCQWGRAWEIDDAGKRIGNGKAFANYGQMLDYISKIMRKQMIKDFKHQAAGRDLQQHVGKQPEIVVEDFEKAVASVAEKHNRRGRGHH